MTLSIDYVVFDAFSGLDGSLRSASDVEIHYLCFLGDINFKVDSLDLSTEWGWVPVLDFAVCISEIVNSLHSSSVGLFEFTESEESISFVLQNDTVKVSASYSEGEAVVVYGALRELVVGFARRLISELSTSYPETNTNLYFRSLEQKYS